MRFRPAIENPLDLRYKTFSNTASSWPFGKSASMSSKLTLKNTRSFPGQRKGPKPGLNSSLTDYGEPIRMLGTAQQLNGHNSPISSSLGSRKTKSLHLIQKILSRTLKSPRLKIRFKLK